jgi:hypothetical protein
MLFGFPRRSPRRRRSLPHRPVVVPCRVFRLLLPIVNKKFVSKMKKKRERKKEKHTCDPRDVDPFFVQFPSSSSPPSRQSSFRRFAAVGRRRHSTPNPPHEHWLVRLGVGGVPFVVVL